MIMEVSEPEPATQQVLMVKWYQEQKLTGAGPVGVSGPETMSRVEKGGAGPDVRLTQEKA